MDLVTPGTLAAALILVPIIKDLRLQALVTWKAAATTANSIATAFVRRYILSFENPVVFATI